MNCCRFELTRSPSPSLWCQNKYSHIVEHSMTYPLYESIPQCHVRLVVFCTNMKKMCTQTPSMLLESEKNGTHIPPPRPVKWQLGSNIDWNEGCFLFTLSLGSDPRSKKKEKKKQSWDKNSPRSREAHMLMHNHNVQYPNLRDYRKIEQWQGHRSIPIMVALCIIS